MSRKLFAIIGKENRWLVSQLISLQISFLYMVHIFRQHFMINTTPLLNNPSEILIVTLIPPPFYKDQNLYCSIKITNLSKSHFFSHQATTPPHKLMCLRSGKGGGVLHEIDGKYLSWKQDVYHYICTYRLSKPEVC